jgi:tRNA (adenine22-N1)-methyltransferase
MMQLSRRLEACLTYTEGYLHLADIGTDHAMLPIVAVLRGNVMDAIAIDNKFGPYLQARNNIKKYDVSDRVRVRLGDGLEKISEETDVVVISGMGGETIATILHEGDHQNVKRFILQPNRDAALVRRTAVRLGYGIQDELVLEDGGKFYDVLVIERMETSYSEDELDFGPVHLRTRPHYFIKRLEHELEQYRSALAKAQAEDQIDTLRATIARLEAILHERT